MKTIRIPELGAPISIVEKLLEGPPGYFDPRTREIVIELGLPEVQKCIVIINELLRLVESTLKQRGALADNDLAQAAADLMALVALRHVYEEKAQEEHPKDDSP